MKPKVLYHGSNKKLLLLEPRLPFKDLKHNSIRAIYATSNKKLATIMGLTNQKGSSSFLSHDKMIINFVQGHPKMKYVYLYHLKQDTFKKNKGTEYISTKKIKPFKVERYTVSDLRRFWRKSSSKELKEFLKNRNKWRTPIKTYQKV